MGLLKEKSRGSSAGTLCPHSAQAYLEEKSRSSSLESMNEAIASPSAVDNAVSKESATLVLISGLTLNRSTMTSIV